MATVSVNITGNSASLQAAVKQAESALGRIGPAADSANKSLSNISKTGRDIQGSLGVIRVDSIVNLAQRAVGAVASLAKLSDEAQNLRGRMMSVTETSGDVTLQMLRIVDISNRTGVSLDATSEAFQKIAMATKPLGYNLSDAAGATETLNKLLIQTGTTGPAAASAMYQIGQALGRGVVAYEDLKQLQESAAPVLQAIAAQFGMTSQQFLAQVQNYKVGSQDIMRALENMKGSVDESFGAMPMTFSRASNMLRNNFIQVLDDLERRYGVFSKLAEGIALVGQNLDKVLPMVVAFAAAWAGMRIATLALELAAVASSLVKIGIAGTLASGARKGLVGLIATVAALGAGWFAFNKAEDVFKGMDSASREARGQIDATSGSVVKLGEAVKTIQLEGPILDLKALMAATGAFLEQYQIIDSMVGLGSARLEQEQAIAAFAKQQRTEYDKIANTEVGAKIRSTVGQSQVAKRATELGAGTTTQTEADYAVTQAAIEKMRQSGYYKQTELDNLEVLQNKAKLDKILQQEQSAADARMQINGVTNQAIRDAVTTQMANVKMAQQGGISGAQGVLGSMTQIYGAMGTYNKQAFDTYKKLALAQALISTYQAAAMAVAAPPGPPWSFVYVAGAIAAGMAQVAAIQSQSYSGRALGGPVMGNKSYIVGERGPELFTPSTSGGITRNQDLGGSSPTVNFNITAADAKGFDDLLIQRRGMITQFVRDAMTENGQRSRM